MNLVLHHTSSKMTITKGLNENLLLHVYLQLKQNIELVYRHKHENPI